MILVDSNLLVYAHVRGAPQHDRANRWLDEQFRSGIRIGLPWHCLLGFVRIVSNPAIFDRPESVADGWKQVRQWLDGQNTWIPQPTERHADILEQIFSTVRTTWRFAMDAHLAALAIEHGVELCSSDRDFARVSKLRWSDPLEN